MLADRGCCALATTQVLHKKGAWFAPYIDDVPGGCVVWFHRDDITDEGAAFLADALTAQSQRWRIREPEEARGPRVPVTMKLEPDMPDGMPIVIDDHPEYVHYSVRADLISQRGADSIADTLTSRTPDWERMTSTYRSHLRAV